MRLRLGVTVLLLVLAGCAGNHQPAGSGAPPSAHVNIPFRIDGELAFERADGTEIARIAIEIARSDSARARGLMQRDALPPDSGMLFVFEGESQRSFWMANTRISLDMIFVSADSLVVDIARYVKPMSPTSTTSRAPAQYVIEVPAGYADSKGIGETDRVRWWRSSP